MWVTKIEVDGLRESIARMEIELENHDRYLASLEKDLLRKREVQAMNRERLAALREQLTEKEQRRERQ